VSSAARRRTAFTIRHRRLANRYEDVDIVEGASQLIRELDAALDRQLAAERRPSERMRMLRETTNRITRAANDAAQAYARTSRGIRTELERPDADVVGAELMRARLDAARGKLLQALEVANRRYAPSDEPTGAGTTTPNATP
jgi:hypothetical protein